MKRIAALSVVYLSLATPASLLAKAPTLKIVIQGADLTTPIQITDGKVLANFQVLSGKGTYANEPRLEEPSFIIDWSQGPTVEPPKSLPRYEILFYAGRPSKRLVYAVSYAFDAVTGEGYVYLPGKNDENYALNVRKHGIWPSSACTAQASFSNPSSEYQSCPMIITSASKLSAEIVQGTTKLLSNFSSNS